MIAVVNELKAALARFPPFNIVKQALSGASFHRLGRTIQ